MAVLGETLALLPRGASMTDPKPDRAMAASVLFTELLEWVGDMKPCGEAILAIRVFDDASVRPCWLVDLVGTGASHMVFVVDTLATDASLLVRPPPPPPPTPPPAPPG